jgi:hypothetical protein
LAEQPSEELDPAFKKLADNLNGLAEKITAEIWCAIETRLIERIQCGSSADLRGVYRRRLSWA